MRFIKTWGLVIALIVGMLLPDLYILAPALPYLACVVLTLSLFGLDASRLRPQWRHALIWLPNLGSPLISWSILRSIGHVEWAEAAFCASISGCAASAPVIVYMLGRDMEFTVTTLVLNSLGVAVWIPLLTPIIVETSPLVPAAGSLTWLVFKQVFLTLLLPGIIVILARLIHPASRSWSKLLATLNLMVWLGVMVIIAANGVHRVQTSAARMEQIVCFGVVALLVCVAGFVLGRLIGGKNLGMECSQCLGQKNTVVGIIVAMQCAAPLVFLGPALYLFFHHAYNTWQLVRFNRSTNLSDNVED